ncbi:hypothetical protein BJV74DRAFT_769099, partial [Russula compacta]
VCKRGRGEDWGEESRKKVAVCIASDGLQEINSRTFTIIMAINAYRDGTVVKRSLAGASACPLHLFSHCTCFTSSADSVRPPNKIDGAEKGTVPV